MTRRRLTLDDVVAALELLGCDPCLSNPDEEGVSSVYARCPLPEHEDVTPSTSWDDDGKGGVLGYCHRCSPTLGRGWFVRAMASIREALARPDGVAALAKAKTAGPSPKRKRLRTLHMTPVADYLYVGLHGRPIAKKARKAFTDPVTGKPGRTFVWYRPLPRVDDPEKFTWIANLLPGTELPLYRADLIEWARLYGAPVYVVEGERDVDSMVTHHFAAVCPPHGADSWDDRYTKALAGMPVVVVADRDVPGRRHARRVATALVGVAASMTLTEPPEPHKDVTDVLEATGQLSLVQLRLEAEPEPDEPVDLLAAIRDGAWLDAQEFPELRYTVPRIVPEGLLLLVGAPKVGKSWLVLMLAIAVADAGIAFAGEGASGVGVERRAVLYLALEDGERRVQDRCRGLLGSIGRIPVGLEFVTRVAPPDVLPTIEAWLELHPVGVVFLDTLGKVMPDARYGETTYSRDYRIGSTLKALADKHPGSAVVVNHHDRKAEAADFIDAVSGTHGLAGAADTIAVLTRKRFSVYGLLQVTGRDVIEGDYALLFDGKRWTLDGDTLEGSARRAAERRATQGVGDRMAEVSAYTHGARGEVSPKQVADALHMDNDQAGKVPAPSGREGSSAQAPPWSVRRAGPGAGLRRFGHFSGVHGCCEC
jgi:AAA domain